MRICRLTILLAISASFPRDARLQERSVPTVTPVSTYANTAEGLKQLLQDMRIAAKDGDERKLAEFVKNTEVPNCDAWLHQMYSSDKADSWMSLCDAKALAPKDKFLQERFVRIAKEDGEIFTRKVNDNPEPGKGLEWGWLQAIRQPLDIYFAGWKAVGEPKEAKGEALGYFVFVDGEFRWNSLIAPLVPAKLVKKVEPAYPSKAASQGVSGTVRISFVIGPDGAVHSAHAISGAGYSDERSLRKAAEEAVMRWRYEPASLNGRAIETKTTVDLTFPPKN